VQLLPINEIHSYGDDLESYPTDWLNSDKPTAMHTSIFGKKARLNFTDATHMKHIFEWALL
jgi:hypothetical protein